MDVRLWEKKKKSGLKPFIHLLAKQHHSSGTLAYWITQKALQNVHLEERKKNSEWAERALCLCQTIRENAGLASRARWHADSAGTVGTGQERDRCCVVEQEAR